MRIINQVFGSKIIIRNIIFLIMFTGLFYFIPKVSGETNQSMFPGQFFWSDSSRDNKIDARAWATIIETPCEGGWLGVQTVTAYAWSYRTCGPGGSPVRNKADVEVTAGEYYIFQASSATVMSNGQTLGLSVGSTNCDAIQFSQINTFSPNACNAPIQIGGGGLIGGCEVNCGGYEPPDTGNCSYCQANWIWTAACSGPYDTNYCG